MAYDIKKELLQGILQLEPSDQEQVLNYVKDLLEAQEMEQRANAAEQSIKEGHVKYIENFKKEFEAWKANKKENIK